MTALIRYSRPWLDDDDIAEVVAVLKSTNLTQGSKVRQFEEALENFCGVPYAAACSSGTAGLHIAALGIGLEKGDEVITSPITFTASANCILYCGATPVFADIDPKTYNISPAEIAKKITGRTRAVIPVHFAGQSCDMAAIRRIVEEAEKKFGRKIYIIEDASHALGSFYRNRPVGSCSDSDLAVMSFHAVKHITTGEGGAVFARDEALGKKMRRFRSHGITSDPADLIFPEASCDIPGGLRKTWYYEQQNLGFNYRLTDIACALGFSQLKKMPRFIQRRREIVSFYNESFKNLETVQRPFESPECVSNFHLYVLLFDFERLGFSRAELMNKMLDAGVQTQVHYIPVTTQPYYQKHLGTRRGLCPAAEAYYKKCLSIPLFPAMTDSDVQRVVAVIKECVS